jgi:hypothetical protein
MSAASSPPQAMNESVAIATPIETSRVFNFTETASRFP